MSDGTQTQTRTAASRWERWLPRASSLAAVITTLCCLGLSAAISLATALGATFLTRDSSLRPILAVTLVLTIVASALTLRRHRNPLPLILTVGAGVLIFWTLFGSGSGHAATADHGSGSSEHAATTEHPATTHSDEHGAAAAPTSAHTDEHSDEHSTAAAGHSDEHSTAAEHPDEHAAAPAGEHSDGMTDGHSAAGGGHGSTTDKVLVWVGIAVLVGAQVWDLLILRSRRRTAALTA